MPYVLDRYKNDLLLSKQKDVRKKKGGAVRPKRGAIKEYSWRSRRRMKFASNNFVVDLPVLVHLTYPKEFPNDGLVTKYHLQRFLQFLRYRKILYFWVIEFQDRDAPHFHIFVSAKIPMEVLSMQWYKIVGSGDEQHLRAGTRVEQVRSSVGAYRYAHKYVAKNYQKIVPESYIHMGRFWGCSRSLLKKNSLAIKEFFRFPSWRREDKKYFFRCLRRWYLAEFRSWNWVHPKWLRNLDQMSSNKRYIWGGTRFLTAFLKAHPHLDDLFHPYNSKEQRTVR